jgi:alpha-glucosidase
MELVEVAAATILPVVRHPFIHYPDVPEVCGLEHQFMVGPDLMVAPVLDPDQRTVEVYLPAGRWVHLWSGEEYGSAERGVYETVSAPIGEPTVFTRRARMRGVASRRSSGGGGCSRPVGLQVGGAKARRHSARFRP